MRKRLRKKGNVRNWKKGLRSLGTNRGRAKRGGIRM